MAIYYAWVILVIEPLELQNHIELHKTTLRFYAVPDWNRNRIRTTVLFGIETAKATGTA